MSDTDTNDSGNESPGFFNFAVKEFWKHNSDTVYTVVGFTVMAGGAFLAYKWFNYDGWESPPSDKTI